MALLERKYPSSAIEGLADSAQFKYPGPRDRYRLELCSDQALDPAFYVSFLNVC